jgi:ATP-dependent Clp protease ATP-binding subunit ClpA
MWQRFTERGRRVIFHAQEVAQLFGEGYVSTEHILLGLIREPTSVACTVIERLGVSLTEIKVETEKQLPQGKGRPSQEMTLTPRAKRTIDLAYDEARNLNNNYIGSEHLLLGLVREGDGLAARVLTKLGCELEAARKVVLNLQDSEELKGRREEGDHWEETPRRQHSAFAFGFNPAPYFHVRQGRYVAEHLFLMLVADVRSDSGQVATAALPNVPALQWEVERYMLSLGPEGAGDEGSSVLQRILDNAASEAKALGHSKVLLRHMLIALAFEKESFVHQPLRERLDQLRQAASELTEEE